MFSRLCFLYQPYFSKKHHFPTAALKINDFSHYPHPMGWGGVPIGVGYPTL